MSSAREKLITSWVYIWLSQIRHRNAIMRCVPKGLTSVTHEVCRVHPQGNMTFCGGVGWHLMEKPHLKTSLTETTERTSYCSCVTPVTKIHVTGSKTTLRDCLGPTKVTFGDVVAI